MRARLKAGLRRPYWLARGALESLAAPAPAGNCPVCSHATRFLGRNDHPREGWRCTRCGASVRSRHLAAALAGEVEGAGGDLAGFRRRARERGLRLLGLGAAGPIHEKLTGLAGYVPTEFWPGVPPGTVRGGIRCEDLQRLSLPDAAVDFVLDADVLEHVRDLEAALGEIRRVLVPGGRHVFSVPCDFDAPTRVRVDIASVPERDLLPPEYHGGPKRLGDRRFLAYRNFGGDLPDIMAAAGLPTRIHQMDDPAIGVRGSYVFVSTR